LIPARGRLRFQEAALGKHAQRCAPPPWLRRRCHDLPRFPRRRVFDAQRNREMERGCDQGPTGAYRGKFGPASLRAGRVLGRARSDDAMVGGQARRAQALNFALKDPYSFSNPKSVSRKSRALSRTTLSTSSGNPFAASASMSSVTTIVAPRTRSSSLRIACAMLLTSGVGRFGSRLTFA
jgi:hypothetical protein